MRTFWCRVGMSIDVTDYEYRTLCGKDRKAAETLLVKILRDPKKSWLSGETYFPEEAQYEYDENIEASLSEESGLAICESDFDLHEQSTNQGGVK